MKKIYYLLVFLFPVVICAQQTWNKSSRLDYTWMNVGDAGFSMGGDAYETKLAISPSGEPYVAYRISSNFHKISVMKFNGTNWENVGPVGFSNSQAEYLNIVFSPSGEPYVAYMDVANSSKVAVKRFDGTDWVDVGIPGFSTSSARGISLAISSSGDTYVSYGGYSGIYSVYGKAIVMKYDGTDWDYVGIPHFSEGMVFSTSLDFSPSGEPYVAYTDSIYFSKATVMKFNGSNWVNVGNPGFSAGYSDFTNIAFGSSGEPYVAYRDGGNEGKASVMKFNGTSWVYVGNAGFSEGWAFYTSLAFGPSGQPYVAYGGGYGNPINASVMKYDGTNWVYVGTEGFSEGDSQYTSLAFSPSGQPYVAYKDFSNQNKATVMKYDSIFVGINELNHSQLSLYPNPTSTTLTIDLGDINDNVRFIEIINGKGGKIKEVQTSENKITIDVRNYPAGMYYVVVTGQTTRIIKKVIFQ